MTTELFKSAKNLSTKLKLPKILDAKAGHFRPASEYEIEAAVMIDSLVFQLECRIEAAKSEREA